MNIKKHSKIINKLKYGLLLKLRLLDIRKRSSSFSKHSKDCIQRIYIINLDRSPKRWKQISNELIRLKSRSNIPLFELSRRFSAVDARYLDEKIDNQLLLPFFTLSDQLQVAPNPLIQMDDNSMECEIEMTPQEVAVALSHISIWKKIAHDNVLYTLILEDDVYFGYGFANRLDAAWSNVIAKSPDCAAFDIMFLSYEEVEKKNKTKIRRNGFVHKPNCGIWYASGYILSKDGAQKLLNMLPAHGPIDLWLNLNFKKLDVLLINKPVIEQRMDVPSTNSYSIMPFLTQIGIYNNRDRHLMPHSQKLPKPIFAFGDLGSGLTSLALALSILGYTCCSDLIELPANEAHNLFTGKRRCYYNAYVNIKQIENWSEKEIFALYPNARIIYTTQTQSPLVSEKVLNLPYDHSDKWETLCSFLGCEYPPLQYPNCIDIGQRKIAKNAMRGVSSASGKKLRFDTSPWIISKRDWGGILIQEDMENQFSDERIVTSWRGRYSLCDKGWILRNDTFPSNLSIFKPENINISPSNVTSIVLKEQITSVRNFTSGAIATQQKFLYGRFVAKIKPINVPGLITGVFLHRNNPHQEIDIEFVGKNTTKMLVNVFYNPGVEGTKLEYGYRGTPVIIDLGFDASKEFHQYEIEWKKNTIHWLVDGNIVYKRVLWDPTPIPNLPMEFNINLWYSKSKELAGKLDKLRIPAVSEIESVVIMQ